MVQRSGFYYYTGKKFFLRIHFSSGAAVSNVTFWSFGFLAEVTIQIFELLVVATINQSAFFCLGIVSLLLSYCFCFGQRDVVKCIWIFL
ncbi:hypothetical protein Pint_26339 [Pistacia integerrima]|uniref:Uncharacterized protein n=1 Tax=Pistacia integerrima TaxID=434235 RepID=A0ACC0YHL7_9ROSI|nr:hypothetical protein Pint_26339 [Pistacia integerrima]